MLRTSELKLFSTDNQKRNLRKVMRKREKRFIGNTIFTPRPHNRVIL